MAEPDPLPPLPEPARRFAPPSGAAAAWGFWATLGWGLLIMGMMLSAQSMVVFLYTIVAAVSARMAGQEMLSMGQAAEHFTSNPALVAATVIIAVPVVLVLVWVLVIVRRGRRLGEYVGAHGFTLRQFFLWACALYLVLMGAHQLASRFEDKSGEEFVATLMASNHYLGLIIFAVTVAAPLSEELLFRGFMFRGMAESRAGWVWAILVPNVLWTSLHVQYAGPTMGSIFAMGLVLGLARYFSGSLLLPIVLHFISNALATVGSLSSHPPSLP